MYKAFQLDFSTFDINTLQKYFAEGNKLYSKHKTSVQKSFSQYLDPDGILNGSRIEEDWFPQKDFTFDLFLSHSHKDEEIMIAFAGFLNRELGLSSFIDSQLWGYCDELQTSVDKSCCHYDDVRKTWNYKDRNISTSYVHNMLMVALTKMMDSTECFFFAQTAASTLKSQATQTLSPWIYSELSISKMLRPLPKREEKVMLYESGGQLRTFSLEAKMKFAPPMDHLIKVSWYDIMDWVGIVRRNRSMENDVHPLDALYQLKGLYK